MGNNEPAVDQSDLRIRGSYGLKSTYLLALDSVLVIFQSMHARNHERSPSLSSTIQNLGNILTKGI